MKNTCILERISKAGIGAFFFFVALGFLLSGITVLPLFGFLVAIPAFLASIYFFSVRLNKSCEIEAE